MGSLPSAPHHSTVRGRCGYWQRERLAFFGSLLSYVGAPLLNARKLLSQRPPRAAVETAAQVSLSSSHLSLFLHLFVSHEALQSQGLTTGRKPCAGRLFMFFGASSLAPRVRRVGALLRRSSEKIRAALKLKV
ncbi:hypothetical protein MRX96_058290 [Rhipicephalus microplus]